MLGTGGPRRSREPCDNGGMRGLLQLVVWLSVAVFSACAPIGAQGRATKKNHQGENVIVLSPSVAVDGNRAAPAWLAYGIAKLALLEKDGAPARKSVTDFDSEVAARTLMLAVWTNLRAKEGGKDAYLDLLLTIKQAGFLKEYVIAALARPGWTIPGKELASLRVADYLAWADDHVPDHDVPTLVEVQSRTLPQNPRVFGDSLPPPAALSPERVTCEQSSSRLTQARQAWLREAKLLAAAPVAVSNRQELLAFLRWAAERAADYPSGVVWVSAKAYKINFFAGFCAIEATDFSTALSALRSAKALLPVSAEPRLEMVQALASSKQIDAAMEELDASMQLPMGRCMQGVAWRKRGFLLFEQRKLKESFQAYQKSLEFDPGNKIAFSELRSLAFEIRGHEKLSAGERREYSPPPVLPGQLTTRCTE
jgi:tetratricopeptide (TPR) repeat protein